MVSGLLWRQDDIYVSEFVACRHGYQSLSDLVVLFGFVTRSVRSRVVVEYISDVVLEAVDT
jgi:Zn ribbon nucleic-acid-binding protein